MNATIGEERLAFQAEVGRLLDLMVNSIYADKEIFLRELISNAADACDKLRYEALTRAELQAEGEELAIRVTVDKAARTITVSDDGIGMNREELVANLGTIARSGTSAFVEKLSGDAARDVKLIGQFGVGFYSAFMVASPVEVISRRAGEEEAWCWHSDGRGAFTVSPAEREGRGTDVVLHLRDGEDEFLDDSRLERVVRTWSDHVCVPVRLGETGAEARTVNSASALWTRSKSEITAEQYRDFYRHVAHAFDEPWAVMHWRAEGAIEYSALLFIPTVKPFDLFSVERNGHLKLHVRRVFITEGGDELLPAWLRFVRGVVDSEDLPLNVSREMLQKSPVLRKIREGLVKRVLSELQTRADKEPEAYAGFWETFGAVLKEGLYEDAAQRDALLKLARFRSTRADGLVSLADYAGRMCEGQQAIFYATGDDVEAIKASPHLEGFHARGVEVLLLDDPVDEFWLPVIGSHDGKPFRSVTRGGADLAGITPREGAPAAADATSKDGGADAPETKGEPTGEAAIDNLVALFRLQLGEAVKDVRRSDRLTESAVCLVAAEGDVDLHLERLLKQHGRKDLDARRILEINPGHPLVRRLAENLRAEGGADRARDYAFLLLDQARILEREPLPDPAGFARRMAAVMQAGLA